MASAGSAYVDILPEFGDFEGQLSAELSSLEGTVEVTAEADVGSAQAEIDSIEGGTAEVLAEAETDGAQAEIGSIDGGEVEVEVEADTSGAQSDISGLSGTLENLSAATGESAQSADAFAGAMAGGASASRILSSGLAGAGLAAGVALGQFAEAESTTAQLEQILQTTGASASISSSQVQELSTEIEHYSGFSDEAITAGTTLLLTFSNVSDEASISAGVLDRATRASADMARIMGGDVPSAAARLGRALDDPARGVTALTRAKVSFTAAEREAITAMAEAGDVLGAQAAILDVVEAQVGGVARAYGQTLAGQIDIAKEKTGDLFEVAGGELAPFVIGFTDGLSAITDALDSVSQATVGAQRDIGNFGASGSSLFVVDMLDVWRQVDNTGQGVAAALGSITTGLTETGVAAGVLGQQFQELQIETFGLMNAEDAFTQSQHALLASVVENGGAITGNTLAAIANRQAMQGLVATTGQRVAMLRGQGASEAQVAGAQRDAISVINRLADRYNWTRAQTERYTDAVLGIPGSASTDIIVNGLGQAKTGIGELTNALNAMDGRTVTATVNILGDNPFFAEGTRSAPPGMAWVGEEGPELVAFGGGEQVYPASESQAIASRSGSATPATVSAGDTHIHFHGPVYGTDDFDARVNDAVIELDRERR